MPVALITGGAGTFGAAIARRLSQDGWSLVIADIDFAAAQAVAASIGADAIAVAMDVTKLDDMRAGLATAVSRMGGVDAAIAAAGGRAGAGAGPFMEAAPESWAQIIELQLTGVINLYYAALAHMRTKRRGSLVAISAVEAYRGSSEAPVFSTAKAGVAVLTETLVRECQPDNIRVNSIIPPVAASFQGAGSGAGAVAEAVAFLLSDKASLTTGAALDVSNGWALH
ncbi:MAG: SDR family oxidoreductase [Beijerinckiaceae bacterium]|nr:SDR family oxidoreductase [Beijerinckiaceae bacterium]